jgi:hypothetical protein
LNVEIGQKNQKHRSGQIIREDVHELGGRRDVQDVDIIDDNAFLNEVDVDLKKLRMLVLNVVGGEVDDADIITIDKSALWQWSMKLLNEPTSFSHVVGHDVILNLDAWSGDDVLALGGPWDEIIAKEHNVARAGSTCIRATRPVRIHVDHQLGGGGASQVVTEV